MHAITNDKITMETANIVSIRVEGNGDKRRFQRMQAKTTSVLLKARGVRGSYLYKICGIRGTRLIFSTHKMSTKKSVQHFW